MKPALLYVAFVPETVTPGTAADKSQLPYPAPESDILWQFNSQGVALNQLAQIPAQSSNNPLPQDNDQLELVIVTGKKPPIRRRVTGATRRQVLKVAQEFRAEITNPLLSLWENSTNLRCYSPRKIKVSPQFDRRGLSRSKQTVT